MLEANPSSECCFLPRGRAEPSTNALFLNSILTRLHSQAMHRISIDALAYTRAAGDELHSAQSSPSAVLDFDLLAIPPLVK